MQVRSFVCKFIKLKLFADWNGCHLVNLDDPRSDIFWSYAIDYVKSRQMRLKIYGCDHRKFNQTKYSNFTKLMKQLDDVDVDWIQTFLPDNSTIEEADSIMAGMKRLKEVNLNFNNFAIDPWRHWHWMTNMTSLVITTPFVTSPKLAYFMLTGSNC